MKSFLSRNWFFIGIVLVILLAFNFPVVGLKVREWNLLKIGIFIAFLLTGLKLEAGQILNEIKNLKGISAALISTFVLFPLIAFILARITFRNNYDFVVGTCICAVAPVTIASGAVLTGLALGNIPLSLFINVTSNLLSIFTIPFSLGILLRFGDSIELPVGQMIGNLFIIVFMPIVFGQLLRIRTKDHLAPYTKVFSVFSQIIVLLIIFNAVASSAGKISGLGTSLVSILLFMIVLHALVLFLNYGLARFLRFDRVSTSAFIIQTSQKTLTVSYIVWAGYFASDFPLAMIPAIGYHLTQLVTDTFLAQRMRLATETVNRSS